MKIISINIGFVTNSSGLIYHFPKTLLKNPYILEFLRVFEIGNGFIVGDPSYRNGSSFAVTDEQKEAVRKAFAVDADDGFSYSPNLDAGDDEFIVSFGDEHNSVASTLADLFTEICDAQGISFYKGEFH
jgi:hypothetical protein